MKYIEKAIAKYLLIQDVHDMDETVVFKPSGVVHDIHPYEQSYPSDYNLTCKVQAMMLLTCWEKVPFIASTINEQKKQKIIGLLTSWLENPYPNKKDLANFKKIIKPFNFPYHEKQQEQIMQYYLQDLKERLNNCKEETYYNDTPKTIEGKIKKFINSYEISLNSLAFYTSERNYDKVIDNIKKEYMLWSEATRKLTFAEEYIGEKTIVRVTEVYIETYLEKVSTFYICDRTEYPNDKEIKRKYEKEGYIWGSKCKTLKEAERYILSANKHYLIYQELNKKVKEEEVKEIFPYNELEKIISKYIPETTSKEVLQPIQKDNPFTLNKPDNSVVQIRSYEYPWEL